MADILLVEDDFNFREILESILGQFDHRVTGAETAPEAVEKARARAFDLLISDVRVAGELDGVEGLRQIRKLQPQIRCIIMTGYSDIDAPLRAASLQADDYLLKPFRMPALVQSVRNVLNFQPEFPNLLRRLGAAPVNAADKARRWFYDAHLQQLQEQREQAMKQLFLLIRSKRIKADEALRFFSAWEELELDRLSDSNPARCASLIVRYHAWAKALLKLEIPESYSDTLSQKSFELIYARVQSGVIDATHLLKAIELLHHPESRRHDLNNFCTYNWVWGEGQEQGDPFLGLVVKSYKLTRLISGPDSPVRLYEAQAEYQPDRGDRVLAVPAGEEWATLLRRETSGDKARHLVSAHDHHFLLYRSFATSLRSRLPGNGLEPWQAWNLLRPVFHQVVGFHNKGQSSGCFSLKDIDWPPTGDCHLSHFSSDAYREAHAQLQQMDGHVTEFFSAPEVLYQPEPTPASDQAVLGRLLFETVFGGRYPDHSLRVHIRMLGQPESNQAFAPYVEKLGPLAHKFYWLAHSNPAERYRDLATAIKDIDQAF
ncbi:response regulator [bacterium]|nr:response regulator [bacterium]